MLEIIIGLISLIPFSGLNKCEYEIVKSLPVIENYVPTELELDIKSTLLKSKSGVYVFSLPQGAGKSVVINKVLNSLVEDGNISGIISFNSVPVNFEIERKTNKPIVLLFDQFDNLRYQEKLKYTITKMAIDVKWIRPYIVILVVTDQYFANNIFGWYEEEYFKNLLHYPPSKYKWNASQFSHLLSSVPYVPEVDKIMNLSLIAGTPAFLLEILKFNTFLGVLNFPKSLKEYAEMINSLWNNNFIKE